MSQNRTEIVISALNQSQAAFNDLKKQFDGLKKDINEVKGRSDGLTAAFSSMAGVLSVGAIAVFVKQAVDGFIAAENAGRQLEQRLVSTGGVVGLTSQQLKELAGSLQQTTIFEDDAVVGAEALLLTFTKIRGPVFEGAIKAILDMSVAMDQDLKTSTIQVGRALNDPIKGITALQRVGVLFTEAQKKQVQSLIESGDAMSAQKLILQELQVEFGGAATAARDTLGGALEGLKNAFGDTLEKLVGEATGGGGLVQGINNLTHALENIDTEQIEKLIKLLEAVAIGVATRYAVAISLATARKVALVAAAVSATSKIGMFGEAIAVAGTRAALTSGIVAALGGPITILTGLLIAGAAAWTLWGDDAKEAAEKAQAARNVTTFGRGNIPTTGGPGTFIPAGKTQSEEAKKWQGAYADALAEGERNKNKPAPKPTDQPILGDPDKLKKAAEEWRRTFATLKTAIEEGQLKPLDEMAARLVKINAKYDELIKKFPKHKAELEDLRGKEVAIAESETSVKRHEKWRDEQEQAKKISQEKADLERDLTAVFSTELNVRLAQEDKWALERLDKLQEVVSTYDELVQGETKIFAAAAKKKLKIQEEFDRQRIEAEVQYQLALIDTEEAYHRITAAEAAEQRLKLNEELLVAYEKDLTAMDKMADPTAWLTQSKAVEELRQKVLDLKLQVRDLSSDFGGGFEEGLRQVIREAQSLFQQGQQLAKGFASELNQAFDDGFFSLLTGKFENLQQILQSFFEGLARQISQILSQRATNAIVNGVLSLFGGGGGGGNVDISWLENARGNAFLNGEVTPFAKGGVVYKPVLFPMAKGLGLMGEAGPEAVMPLTRTGDGSLGVRALGGGGNVTSNVVINVDSSGNTTRSQSSQGMSPAVAEQLGRMIDNAVLEVIIKQKRAGGLLA